MKKNLIAIMLMLLCSVSAFAKSLETRYLVPMEVDFGAVHSVINISDNVKLILGYPKGQPSLLKHLCISYLYQKSTSQPFRWSNALCLPEFVNKIENVVLSEDGNMFLTIIAEGNNNERFELRNFVGKKLIKVVSQ